MKKIAIIVGTRPEAIKLMPVYLAFKNIQNIQVDLVSTGQHKEMLSQVFDIFEVQPNVSLELMTKNQTLNGLAGKLITSLDELTLKNKYDGVIVQGDTLTAMVGAMVSFNNRIDVFHIEAGLRSYDMEHPFPEEANRRVIGVYSTLNFTPTSKASNALFKEGYPEHSVINVGNTVIDALLAVQNKINSNYLHYENKFSNITSKKRHFVLVTAHRRENFGQGFKNICEALIELSKKHKNLDFIYPVHLNPNVQAVVKTLIGNISNIKLIDPLSYDDMIYFMSEALLILSDSGGIQEEAPSLNIPVVVLREKTERMEGVESGCSVLVGTSKNKIVKVVDDLLTNNERYTKMSTTQNPYGDGKSSQRVVEHISTFYSNK